MQEFGWYGPIILDFLPPSGNHLKVINWKRKIQFTSTEGKKFKQRFLTEVVPTYQALFATLDKEGLYEVQYAFYFDPNEILNKTFGQKDGAATRYKKMDVENRLKFLSDCLSEAMGIDDSHYFSVGAKKFSASLCNGVPQLHIYFRQLDPTGLGI